MKQRFGNHQDSFDMEFMMPPDINSIDSDINKIGALTPSLTDHNPNNSSFMDTFTRGGIAQQTKYS